jgi:undecaprenyl-diphosphatase
MVNGLDQGICLWINGWPEGLSPFLTFFSNATNYLVVKLALLALIIAMLVVGVRSRYAVLQALIAVGLANPITDLLKHVWPMHRPFQPQALGQAIHLRVGYADSMGTASAHTANMTAVATVMFLSLGRWGWPWGWFWAAVALLTGISRIYTGAHFPSQVLLGSLVGLGTGFLVVTVWRKIAAAKRPVDEPQTA